MPEIIKETNALEEYTSDMVAYSIAVIRRRALCEIRDGLKPIQRRVIWDLYHDMPGDGFIKSKRVSGDVIGKYSPHGDDAAYQAFRPILNDFQTKLPLLEGQGNFGTLAGDGASSSRYTEVRLSKFAKDAIIKNLEDDNRVVDFSPNFDNKLQEPDYLPVSVPLLLMQGCNGIAIGIASSIPVHNTIEVLDVTRKLLHNPDYNFVLIPDQCQPTYIIDTDWKKINKCGGTFRVRGIVEIGEYKAARDRETFPALFVKSLPDGIYSGDIYTQIHELHEKKQVPMIRDVWDITKNSVDIIIQLNKGADPEYVKQLLYKKTSIETSMKVNFEVIDGIESKYMSYKEYLLKWIEYRKITKFRQYNLRQKNIATRMHTLKTYVQAMESGYIDEIIALIRRQEKVDDKNVLTEFIIKKCKMTKLQAEFLLAVDLRRLAAGYLPIYKSEIEKLEVQKQNCEDHILNPELIIQELDEEMAELAKKYGTPRMAQVIREADDTDIPQGTFKLVITENNFVRKLSLDDRVNAIKGDQPKFIMKVENTESVTLFDDKGRVFCLPIHKVTPTDAKTGTGLDLKLLIKNCTADIAAAIYTPQLKAAAALTKNKHYLAVVTAGNFIKRMDLNDFMNIPAAGMIYTKLANQNDVVKDVIIAPANMDVIVYSGHKALRISAGDIPEYKRASQGVYAMNTNDTISGLSLIYPDATHIVIVTTTGRISKFDIVGLAKGRRNMAGSSVMKLGKQDSIVSIYGVNDSNTLLVITTNGRHTVKVADIPVGSSVSSGIKMLEDKNYTVLKAEVVG